MLNSSAANAPNSPNSRRISCSDVSPRMRHRVRRALPSAPAVRTTLPLFDQERANCPQHRPGGGRRSARPTQMPSRGHDRPIPDQRKWPHQFHATTTFNRPCGCRVYEFTICPIPEDLLGHVDASGRGIQSRRRPFRPRRFCLSTRGRQPLDRRLPALRATHYFGTDARGIPLAAGRG